MFLSRVLSVVDRGVKLRHGLDLIGGEISVGGLGYIAKCNVIQRPKTTTVCELWCDLVRVVDKLG